MEEDQGYLISGVGWDEHPEEINNSAMAKFCFVSILSRNEEKAWIVIRIEDVLLLMKNGSILFQVHKEILDLGHC